MEDTKIEGFLYWIGLCCGNKGIRRNGDKLELMWYIYQEADSLYDGINDDKLPLYTTKEMIEKYGKMGEKSIDEEKNLIGKILTELSEEIT